MPVAELFKALGDPTRLRMVQRLSSGATYTVSTVSSELGISRQGARKHLQVLVEAKLVNLEANGREISVQLDRSSLESAKVFIGDLERQWDRRLQKLSNFLEKEKKELS